MFLDTIIVIKLLIEIIIFTHLIIQIIYNKNKSKKLFVHFFILILIITFLMLFFSIFLWRDCLTISFLNKIEVKFNKNEKIQFKESLYANIILILYYLLNNTFLGLIYFIFIMLILNNSLNKIYEISLLLFYGILLFIFYIMYKNIRYNDKQVSSVFLTLLFSYKYIHLLFYEKNMSS